MQLCNHCQIRLIIGITGELLDNGTNSPNIVCQHCGEVNQATRAAYISEPSEMECEMCGKEGAHERGNGIWMCGHCWTTWNG